MNAQPLHLAASPTSAQRRRRGRGRQQIYTTAWSTASPDQVWQLLADATTWPDWAGFDEAYYENDEGAHTWHGVGAVRRFRIGRLTSRESVLSFEPGRRLSYDYVGSLPLVDYRGDVKLARHRGGTRIAWRAEFTSGWPLAGPLLRIGMTRVLGTVATRLASAAENATQSQEAGRPTRAATEMQPVAAPFPGLWSHR